MTLLDLAVTSISDLDPFDLSSSVMENLWEVLEEPLLNVEEFEDAFSKVSVKKKATPEKTKKLKKTKEVRTYKLWSEAANLISASVNSTL